MVDSTEQNLFQLFLLSLPSLTCQRDSGEVEGVVEVVGGEVDRRLKLDMLLRPMPDTLHLLSTAPARLSTEMQVMQCLPMLLETMP